MSGPAPYPRLLSPVQVGPLTLRNRVVSTSHQTGLVHDHLPTDEMLAYHEARARGGAGAVFIEATATDPTGLLTAHTIGGFLPEIVPVYRRLAERVHAAGARRPGPASARRPRADLELAEAAGGGTVGDPQPALQVRAPGAHRRRDRRAGRRLRDLRRPGGRGRTRRHRGLDVARIPAVPVPLSRCPTAVATATTGRSRPGCASRWRSWPPSATRSAPAMALGVRLSADELAPGGLGTEQCAEIAARLHGDGLVDFISLVLGHSAFPAASTFIAPPPPVPLGGDRRARRRDPRGRPRRNPADHDPSGRPGRRRGAGHRRHRRSGGHDAGDDRRPRPGGQGAGGARARADRVRRVQPGLHRPLPRRRADRLRGQRADRARADVLPRPGTDEPRPAPRAGHRRRSRGRRRGDRGGSAG